MIHHTSSEIHLDNDVSEENQLLITTIQICGASRSCSFCPVRMDLRRYSEMGCHVFEEGHVGQISSSGRTGCIHGCLGTSRFNNQGKRKKNLFTTFHGSKNGFI